MEMPKSFKDVSDEEVTRRKNDKLNQIRLFEELLKKIKDVLEILSQYLGKEKEVGRILRRFEKLTELKADYLESLKPEVEEREILKQSTFKESLLNIRLSKFSGLNYLHDIYTFKNEFEKTSSRTVPKLMLPELLRNSYLEDPVLLIEKSVQNIVEIWERLKKAYGDPKMMLSKRLCQLKNVEKIK